MQIGNQCIHLLSAAIPPTVRPSVDRSLFLCLSGGASIYPSVSLLVSVWRCVHPSVGLSSCVCLAVRPSIRRSLFLCLSGGASIHPSVSLLVSVCPSASSRSIHSNCVVLRDVLTSRPVLP